MEIPFQDEERGGHVVVAVGHHRASLSEGEDLLAKDVAVRSSLDLGHSGAMAARPVGNQPGIPGNGLEVYKLQELGEVDLVAEQVFHLFLPLGLCEFLVLHREADLIDLVEPLLGRETGFPGEEIAAAEMLKQRDSEQGLNGLPAKIPAGCDEGLLVRIFHY